MWIWCVWDKDFRSSQNWLRFGCNAHPTSVRDKIGTEGVCVQSSVVVQLNAYSGHIRTMDRRQALSFARIKPKYKNHATIEWRICVTKQSDQLTNHRFNSTMHVWCAYMSARVGSLACSRVCACARESLCLTDERVIQFECARQFVVW